MNKSVDKKIIDRLQEHKNEVIPIYKKDWFVIAAQGSMNYPGLFDEGSDIDSKMLILPSFKDIVFNKKSISHTHEMSDNKEHADVKDVRDYMTIARKQNINFVEIFFTDYWIANSYYEDLWLEMRLHAEEFVHMNPYRTMKCIKGMAFEKQHALTHPYPSKLDLIKKYGYDPKQLSHAIRLEDFANKYVAGYSYKDCLKPFNSELLLKIKRGDEDISLEQAQIMMDNCVKKISQLEESFNKYHKDENNLQTKEKYDNILYRLIERSVKKELQDDLCYRRSAWRWSLS